MAVACLNKDRELHAWLLSILKDRILTACIHIFLQQYQVACGIGAACFMERNFRYADKGTGTQVGHVKPRARNTCKVYMHVIRSDINHKNDLPAVCVV